VSDDQPESQEPIPLPIEGELDLHTFQPRDIKELLPEYLRECQQRGILCVRIVHGKGIGNLRRTVHALLGRIAAVESFALASELLGGWGATMVRLRPLSQESKEEI
jgi:DNA-nicking Smr family endonuclease